MCGSIDGHWSTEIGARSRSNDVSIERCAMGCPSGTLSHHLLNGASLLVTFDGTSTATWSTSAGRSGTTQLLCQ